MEIEPISSVVEPKAPEPVLAEPAHLPHEPTPLGEAKAQETETTEQRAFDGDPLAEIQLAKEEERHIPIDAQQLLPAHAEHPAGAHEPGKGNLIDIYD